jgi:ubiquitin-conjugating enzyme E2 O
VRRALEIPLGSLEDEINWLYYKQDKLQKVLADARSLVKKSRDEPVDSKTVMSSDRAVPRLTSGAIITLERILSKLEALKKPSSLH